MHGVNPFATRNGPSGPSPVAAAAPPSPHGVVGLRNLFHCDASPIDPADLYDPNAPGGTPRTVGNTGGGSVIMAAAAIMPDLSTALRKLDARMARGHNELWADRLKPLQGGPVATENWENPSIPAGYTYFLQLIAHDTVDSAVAFSAGPTPHTVLENTRRRPLMLDTIYGAGPDVHTSAYEFDIPHRDSKGAVPRTRLRVGPRRSVPGLSTSDCPFRDIARATTAGASPGLKILSDDAGIDSDQRRDWTVTDAAVADIRNDSHPLISQFTVLIHMLHNQIMTMLDDRAVAEPPECSPSEAAYRRFLAARFAVTSIYRNIVENDVLHLILHASVYGFYRAPERPLLDPNPGIPREFSHAAFRFGHAMVRNAYLVNTDDRPQSMRLGLKQSSTREPNFVPISDDWLVDWARFFGTNTVDPNLSRRIGPDYASVLRDERVFPADDAHGTPGLSARDIKGACFAGIWSTPRLYAKVLEKTAGTTMAGLLPPFDAWRERLREWLEDGVPSQPQDQFSAAEIEAIADNPPLSFFVLFEAAHSITGGKPVVGGGRHLGPLGSIIVGEALFGALKLQPPDGGAAGSSLRECLRAGCRGLLNDEQALDDVMDIKSMPTLLAFMARQRAFTADA